MYLHTSGAPRKTGTIDSHETFSYPVYDALRQQQRGLAQVIAYVPVSGGKVAERYDEQPEEAEGDMVGGENLPASDHAAAVDLATRLVPELPRTRKLLPSCKMRAASG